MLGNLCVFAWGQTISVILSSDAASFKQVFAGFNKQIQIKNPNQKIVEHILKGNDSELLISQVAQDKPDIVLTIGIEATKIAKEKIKNTQVVFCMVFRADNYIDAKTTGISLELPAKMKLENIREILPKAKTMGTIYSTDSEREYNELSAEAEQEGFRIIGKKIDKDSDFPVALQELADKMDCFMMIADARIYFSQTIKYLLLESLKNKFPVIGLSSFYTKAGALASFDGDYGDIGCQAADVVESILDGADISNIKIQRPRKINYSINALVADRMQIRIPSNVIKSAFEVFN